MIAKPGDKVVYIGYSGYSAEIRIANGIFLKGRPYIVDEVNQDGFNEKLKIVGTNLFFPDAFFKKYNAEHDAHLDFGAQPDQDQMTLRDQFAMAVLPALITFKLAQSPTATMREISKAAYLLADDCMEARKK